MNKFLGFLEAAGKDFMKGLGWAVKEAPAVDRVANLIWPASVAVTVPVTLGLNLLQNGILAIEQKYAASGVQSGTGPQKAAEVLALAGPAASALFMHAGVPEVNDGLLGNLIKLLVDVLNVTAPVTAVVAKA